MTNIDTLNNRFAEALGRPDGVNARYQWAWKKGILMNTHQWFICQLMPNPFTPEQWDAIHEGRRPYPGKLRIVEHTETALPVGVVPNDEHTAFYIRTLRAQMEAAELAIKDAAAGRVTDAEIQSEAEALAHVQDAQRQHEEAVADWEPWSWRLGDPQPDGSQDGAVAFQVGGSRDDAPTTT